MKTFKDYMSEETNPFALSNGFVGVEDEKARDNINALLNGITMKPFLTPYIGLERVAKVLANYHIHLPKHTFDDIEGDSVSFEVNQFGQKSGMTNDGEVVTKMSDPYYIYFEYKQNEQGTYDVFCEIVDEDDLEELMSGDEDDAEELDEGVIRGTAELVKHGVMVPAKAAGRAIGGTVKAVGAVAGGVKKTVDDIQTAAKQVSAAYAKKSPKKVLKFKKKEEQLDENYHSSYSSAIQTAVASAAKRGYKVDEDDYHNKVSAGPRKPSEGKTVSHTIKLTKDGKPTKKSLAIQVYNRGGDKTPYELNHYISEEKSGMPAWYEKEKSKSASLRAMTKEKKKEQKKKTDYAIRNMKEEEQLDEVSRKLAKKYVKAAKKAKDDTSAEIGDNRQRMYTPGYDSDKLEKQQNSLKRDYMNRSTGIARAKKILAKEEQLDELDQETLKNYHAASGLSLKAKRQKLDKGTLTSKDLRQGQNRVKGLNRSAKKMNEEQLDEKLSTDQKRVIRKKLGPDTPNNLQRKGTESARAYIQKATGKYPKYGFPTEETIDKSVVGPGTIMKTDPKTGKKTDYISPVTLNNPHMQASKDEFKMPKKVPLPPTRPSSFKNMASDSDIETIKKDLMKESNPAKEGMIAAGYKGSNPAEQGSIAVKKDDEARDRKANFKVAKKLARQASKTAMKKAMEKKSSK